MLLQTKSYSHVVKTQVVLFSLLYIFLPNSPAIFKSLQLSIISANLIVIASKSIADIREFSSDFRFALLKLGYRSLVQIFVKLSTNAATLDPNSVLSLIHI
eukprot:TRINITY_DN15904_c0_g1_i1.p1 TRINITY_DN15904_c0_g1~~TRINITY_DN15904_c0_g1_i1.p1  ORF type:complete len:101 (-),score=1.76 TRINITY_DN15904_c0_g1_i1:59-361(-)